jgi:MFS family permease
MFSMLIKQKNFLMPTFMAAIFMAAVNIYSPFLAPYLVGKGFHKEDISSVFAVAPFVLIISSAVFGKLSDRLGRRNIINLCLFLEALAILLFLYTKNSLFIVAAASVLANIGEVGHDLAVLQRAEDNIIAKRGTMTGIFQSVRSLGVLAGSLLGTVIVSFLPIAFTFKITFATLFFIALINNLGPKKNYQGIKYGDLNFIRNIREFWSNAKLRKMGILGMAMHFTIPASAIFIPLFIVEDLGGSLIDVGIFASLVSFFSVFQFYSGKMCDKKGDGKIIFLSVFFYAMALGSLFFAPSMAFFYIIVSLIGLSGGFWNTSAWCYMSKIGEEGKNIGLVTGSYISVAKIGNVISFLVSGFIANIFGARVLFLIYGIIIILASFLFLEKRPKQNA